MIELFKRLRERVEIQYAGQPMLVRMRAQTQLAFHVLLILIIPVMLLRLLFVLHEPSLVRTGMYIGYLLIAIAGLWALTRGWYRLASDGVFLVMGTGMCAAPLVIWGLGNPALYAYIGPLSHLNFLLVAVALFGTRRAFWVINLFVLTSILTYYNLSYHDLVTPEQKMLAYTAVRELIVGQILFLCLTLTGLAAMGRAMEFLDHQVSINRKLSEELEERVRLRTEELHEKTVILEDREKQTRELAEAAKQASVAKSEFLANMSHEIRTPMNGVVGMAELLTHTSLDKEQGEYVHTIMESGSSLLTIINDILDYSKVESGKLEIHSEPVDIRRLIHGAFSVLRNRAEEKHLEYLLDIDDDMPVTLNLDKVRVRQVLINLLGNAIKFSHSGAVRLYAIWDQHSGNKGTIRFQVEDTGIGMDELTVAKVFERFVQGDGTTTRKYGGSGLGLSISKSLSQLMGGDLELHSTHGEGTKAKFWIPTQILSDTVSPEHPSPTHETDARFSDMRILVVEDNLFNQKVISAMLRKLGAKVQIASNGHIALKSLETEHFDLIFMDCNMPVMDGFEATRRIRQWEADGQNLHPSGHLPIVALTAAAMVGDKEQCLAAGMDSYLTKPIHLADVMQVMQG